MTARDGFNAGTGLVLTVLKLWLALALASVLAAALFEANALAGAAALAAVGAAILPFVRLGWLRSLRDGLAGHGDPRFRAGLIAALATFILCLWAGLLLFTALTRGVAPGGAAAVPFALNAATGVLAAVATVLAAIALWRLRPRHPEA